MIDWVRKAGLKTFTERYRTFCRREGYSLNEAKAKELFTASRELVAVSPKGKNYKKPIEMSIRQLRTLTETTVRIRGEMDDLASTLPEYDTFMAMYGVGKALGPQLIAEIGDVSRFTHRKTITAFTGVDPGVDESGKYVSKSNQSSNVGSPV